MPPKRGNKYGDTDSSEGSSTIKKNNSFSLRNKQRHIKLCKGGDTIKRCDECDLSKSFGQAQEEAFIFCVWWLWRNTNFSTYTSLINTNPKCILSSIMNVKIVISNLWGNGWEIDIKNWIAELKRTNSFQVCQRKKQLNIICIWKNYDEMIMQSILMK